MAGAIAGLMLGLGLQAPVAPQPELAQPLPPAAEAPVAVRPAPVAPGPEPDRASELAALRTALATAQAQINAMAEARASAEAEIAALRRDLAASRRDAIPPVAAPLRPPRTEAPAPPPVASGQPRVFVHMRAGSTAAADAAASLAGQLRDAGFEVADMRAVASTPSQRVVRYFHAEDAPAAARLAGRLGRGWAIQDFRTFEPSPSPHTLEIWLPDR